MLHVLERPRNDDAVVVAAVARPDADQLVGAEMVVLAGRRVGIDLGNLEHAALLPSLGQVADVGHPVVFERRDHARGLAVEARRDVLLPVGDEIALRGLGIDVHVPHRTIADIRYHDLAKIPIFQGCCPPMSWTHVDASRQAIIVTPKAFGVK